MPPNAFFPRQAAQCETWLEVSQKHFVKMRISRIEFSIQNLTFADFATLREHFWDRFQQNAEAGAVIVAHPDDEKLWLGRTILSNPA